MTEADRSEIELLYQRVCPGQKANLGTDANRLSAVVERNGKIVAAVLGNFALVSIALLLADPDAADSKDAAHDATVALGPLIGAVREASEPGAVVGQVVVVPDRLRALGDAMGRAGFLSRCEGAAVHSSWDLNVPGETPIATS